MARLPDGYRVEPGTGRLVRITQRKMTQRRFMGRISFSEYHKLNRLRIDPAVDLDLRAALDTLAELRDMSDEVDLDDDDAQFGVAVAINTLVSLPEGDPVRIPIEQAAARVDAWLADFPQPGEPT